jgi:hypothetical protein
MAALFLRTDEKILLEERKIVYNLGVMTKREQELADAGWERRFIASEPRLARQWALRSIGFECSSIFAVGRKLNGAAARKKLYLASGWTNVAVITRGQAGHEVSAF